MKATKGSNSGVTVSVSELGAYAKKCLAMPIRHELEQIFALYLLQYPNVKIYFDDVPLEVSKNIHRKTSIDLPNITSDEPVSLEIVEWNIKTKNEIYLCNNTGFPIEEITPSINTTGYNFTAYLKSDYFSQLFLQNQIELWEMDDLVVKSVENAKDLIRDHFRELASKKRPDLLKSGRSRRYIRLRKNPKILLKK